MKKIKIKGVKTEAKRQKKVAHGGYSASKYVGPLCGQPGIEVWECESLIKKITCDACLVKMDQMLESGFLTTIDRHHGGPELITATRTELFVTYTEQIIVVEPGDEDGGPWSYQGTKNLQQKFKMVSLSAPKDPNHLVLFADFAAKPGDTVYLAVCTYTSGDSFGQTKGQLECLGAYETADEAATQKTVAVDRHSGWQDRLESFETIKAILQP